MAYASFSILTHISENRHGGVPILHPPIAFYHHIPEEFRQRCALCDEEFTPTDQHMVLICPLTDLNKFVLQYNTTAAVTALLSGTSFIGAAHDKCIVSHLRLSRTNITYLQQALPYYEYIAQLFDVDFYAHRGRIYIKDKQQHALLQARERWIRDQALSFNDPPTWICCTLIAAMVSAFENKRDNPSWNLVIPSHPDLSIFEVYMNEVTHCMQRCAQWTDANVRACFKGTIFFSSIYPIIDYSRLG